MIFLRNKEANNTKNLFFLKFLPHFNILKIQAQNKNTDEDEKKNQNASYRILANIVKLGGGKAIKNRDKEHNESIIKTLYLGKTISNDERIADIARTCEAFV